MGTYRRCIWFVGKSSPNKFHLAEGYELANSWAVDLHKWLNVPYDSGIVICKDPQLLQNALSVSAAYLPDPWNQNLIFIRLKCQDVHGELKHGQLSIHWDEKGLLI